jgi:hypothetical protein
LECAAGRGELNLREAQRGLRILPAGARGGLHEWFRLPCASLAGQAPDDAYVRGRDLIARYPSGECDNVGLSLYWRLSPSATQRNGDDDVLEVEFVVSAQTETLESYPNLAVSNESPAGPCYARGSSGWSALAARHGTSDTGGVLIAGGAAHPAVLLAVYPGDLASCRVGTDAGTARVVVDVEMIAGFLEKGVIRRGRMRAALLPASHGAADERWLELAERHYQSLVASPLPLTA